RPRSRRRPQLQDRPGRPLRPRRDPPRLVLRQRGPRAHDDRAPRLRRPRRRRQARPADRGALAAMTPKFSRVAWLMRGAGVCAVLVAGCAHTLIGRDFARPELSWVVSGQTTKTDVVRAYGSPVKTEQVISHDQAVSSMGYTFARNDGQGHVD